MLAQNLIVAEFQFSQPSYNVSEDSEVVSVCLELINGVLTEEVVIEIVLAAGMEVMALNRKFNLEVKHSLI